MKKRFKITFFGDSISFGQGISLYQGWVTKFARFCDENPRGSYEILVENNSVNGRTTRQALEDMPYALYNDPPNILILQFGLNDCNYWESDLGSPRVSLGSYVANLQEMVERATKIGVSKIVLLNSHPTTLRKNKLTHTDFTFEDSNRLYSEACRKMADSYSNEFEFIDIYLAFTEAESEVNLSELLLPDGLHLSDKGHDLYYQIIRRHMTSFFEDMDLT